MRPCGFRACAFLRFHELHQIGDSFFHYSRALGRPAAFRLWGRKKGRNMVFCDKGSLNYIERSFGCLTRFLGIDVDVVDNPFHQRMFSNALRQALFAKLCRRLVFCLSLKGFRRSHLFSRRKRQSERQNTSRRQSLAKRACRRAFETCVGERDCRLHRHRYRGSASNMQTTSRCN